MSRSCGYISWEREASMPFHVASGSSGVEGDPAFQEPRNLNPEIHDPTSSPNTSRSCPGLFHVDEIRAVSNVLRPETYLGRA